MAPRMTFFGGKGGVGKTTCSAAAAVRAAEEGHSVLVVSTDPAHSLGDALATKLGPAPKRVGTTELYAAQLDADRALTRWLADREDAFRTIAERGTYLDDEDVDRLLSLSLPGVDELVGLIELARLARTRPWDIVVVDTAPTGHTVRLLEMPETLRRLAEILDDMHAKHRFLAASLGRGWRPDFADEVISEIEREAIDLRAMLRSRSSFTWITLPEELPARESLDGVRAIEAIGAHVDVVVVNRVWPKPEVPCPLCVPRVAAEAVWREHIAATFAGRTILEVPARVKEPRGIDALRGIALSVREHERRAPAPRRRTTKSAAVRSANAALPLGRDVRLVLFGGKGGVGKTTASAAAALELANLRPKEKVLVLSTDPAHSLGDAFGEELGDVPKRPIDAPKNLVARELDAAQAFAVERERYRQAIDDLFASIFRGRMDATFDRKVLEDLLDLAPPGIDELLATVSLVDALEDDQTVVVDTAPTGHTLRLLELPDKALEWVHALMSVILKYRSVIGLGELASDLTSLAKRLRRFIALLHDPRRTAFIAVTRAADLPVLETERLVSGLAELDVPLAAILVNGVSETIADCPQCAAVAKEEAPRLARLARLAKVPVVVAPLVFPTPRGPSELRLWRTRWHERQ